MTPLKLGFLASHRGSNMQAIIDACKSGKIDAKPEVVISNNQESGALERAKTEGIAAYHISTKSEGSEEAADKKISEVLKRHAVDFVILAGYMRKIGPAMLGAFEDRIINVHPALLPKYGGQGMYGMFVHEAVLKAGDTVTGVTIHLVNSEYDKGRVLAQIEVPVEKSDTPDSLAKRVLKAEHELYVETIAKIAKNKGIC